MVGRVARWILLKPDRGRGVGLRVAINEEGRLLGGGEACRQIYGRGRFSNTAFLVGHGDDPGQRRPPNPAKITEAHQGSKMFHVERWESVEDEFRDVGVRMCSTWNWLWSPTANLL